MYKIIKNDSYIHTICILYGLHLLCVLNLHYKFLKLVKTKLNKLNFVSLFFLYIYIEIFIFTMLL